MSHKLLVSLIFLEKLVPMGVKMAVKTRITAPYQAKDHVANGRCRPRLAADGQAAASPAGVSVSISSSTVNQPWLTAYAQAILKSGIFQSPTSEVSARSSRVSFPPIRQVLSYTTIANSRRPSEHLRCLFAWTLPSDPWAISDPLFRVFSHAPRITVGIAGSQ